MGVVQGAPLKRDNNGDDGMSTQENYVAHLGRLMLCWAPPSCLSPLLGAVAATAWVPRQLVTVVEWAEGSCPCRVEALAHLPFTQSLHVVLVGREEGKYTRAWEVRACPCPSPLCTPSLSRGGPGFTTPSASGV